MQKMKNSNSKVTYAIVEIVIVVIGIFIAFELQNFKERLTIRQERVSLVKSFIFDLKRDSTILANVHQFDSSRAVNLKSLINLFAEKSKNYDSISALLESNISGYQDDFSTRTTFDIYTSNGESAVFDNDSIPQFINNYYQITQPFYKNWRKIDLELSNEFDYDDLSMNARKKQYEMSLLSLNEKEIPQDLTNEIIDVYSKELGYMEYMYKRQVTIQSMSQGMKVVLGRCVRTKEILESYLEQIE